MKIVKNKKGIALMMVLSAIVLLTTMLVEFAYNTSINHHLALNSRDRLQAYYLAKSAYSFMMLELKFDKVFRKVVEQQNLSQYLGANAQLPLCQQFPLSTGLIRTVFSGGGLESLMGGGGEDGLEAEPSEDLERMQKDASISDTNVAEEFLNFEGDFDGECVDEATKIDLNGFVGLSTAAGADGAMSAFDQYKQFLFRFMARPEFDLLFEASDVKVSDVITNIGDWVDDNTEINEFGGRSGGLESSLYDAERAKYTIKNGKLITLMEAYLIEGVMAEWFEPMKEYFTIYGDGKINVCTSNQNIIESLIRRYVDSTPNLPPLRLEDPEEMTKLVDAVSGACQGGSSGTQLANQVGVALNEAIGAIAGESENDAEGERRMRASGAGFARYVSTASRYFTLKLAGQVIDTIVRIEAVVDVADPDPKKWKILYWRVY